MAEGGKSGILVAADYIVFAAMLLLSASTGFFYAWKDRKENNMDNYHRGKRKASPLAVSLSLSVTIVSALAILSSSEIYTYGTMIAWQVIGMLVGTVFSAYVLLPIFYNMDKISVFEYINLRFGKVTRILCSVIFMIINFIVQAFVLYAPCLAFQALSGVSLWIIMIITAFVAVFYTFLGGLKAVLWADTLQFFIIVAGLVCILIEGSMSVGGFGKAWQIANEQGRVELLDFSFDPRTRHTVWGLVIGYSFTWIFAFGVNQVSVQRACSLPTLKTAQLAELASYPGVFLIIILVVLNGVVIFAYYHTCDPVTNGRISKNDQLFPLLITDLLGKLPGLPGLLLACLFSASLSSLSSGLNAMSAVLIEDFIKRCRRITISENMQVIVSKMFVLLIGTLIFGLAALISQLGGLMHQLLHTLAGIFVGPLLGVFYSGLFFPWVNEYGAGGGLIGAIGFSSWLIFGAIVNTKRPKPLPVSVAGCDLFNNSSPMSINITTRTTDISVFTTSFATTIGTVKEVTETPALYEFYKMSYMWYAAYGTGVCIIIALIVSFLTKPNNPKDVDARLISPLFYNLCPFLPEKYRKHLLLGVDFNKTLDKDTNKPKLKSFYYVDDQIRENDIGKFSTKF